MTDPLFPKKENETAVEWKKRVDNMEFELRRIRKEFEKTGDFGFLEQFVRTTKALEEYSKLRSSDIDIVRGAFYDEPD